MDDMRAKTPPPSRYQKFRADAASLVADVLALYANGTGMKQVDIARKLRITRQRVCQIVHQEIKNGNS